METEPNKTTTLRELATKQFEAWARALFTKEVDTIVSLYAERATLLPTLDPKLKEGHEEIKSYFQHFLKKNPLATIIKDGVRKTSVDNRGNVTGFLHFGSYDFEVDSGESRMTLHGKFDFFWEKNNAGEWKIFHHLSALLPEQE